MRAFVAVADRSLAAAGTPITLPQFRTLAVLATVGPQTAGALAALVSVDPSTMTRMCDRLVSQRLIRRQTARADRRAVTVSLTESGRAAVDRVRHRRRQDLAAALRHIEPRRRARLLDLLGEFAAALAAGANTAAAPTWIA